MVSVYTEENHIKGVFMWLHMRGCADRQVWYIKVPREHLHYLPSNPSRGTFMSHADRSAQRCVVTSTDCDLWLVIARAGSFHIRGMQNFTYPVDGSARLPVQNAFLSSHLILQPSNVEPVNLNVFKENDILMIILLQFCLAILNIHNQCGECIFILQLKERWISI